MIIPLKVDSSWRKPKARSSYDLEIISSDSCGFVLEAAREEISLHDLFWNFNS